MREPICLEGISECLLDPVDHRRRCGHLCRLAWRLPDFGYGWNFRNEVRRSIASRGAICIRSRSGLLAFAKQPIDLTVETRLERRMRGLAMLRGLPISQCLRLGGLLFAEVCEWFAGLRGHSNRLDFAESVGLTNDGLPRDFTSRLTCRCSDRGCG